jgi:peptidylprolyl isomerase
MHKHLLAALALTAALPLMAQAPATPATAKTFPAPSEIVAAALASDWVAISPNDLLVMDMTDDAKGKPRRVIIQLMPAPFSEGWVGNIRTLAKAHWWDGLSVNRVQDNYVAQWGDADGEDAKKAKPLPAGLTVMPESNYVTLDWPGKDWIFAKADGLPDSYGVATGFHLGWPLAQVRQGLWPIHCYGMVGVGRGMSPDTGSGAELYTVIGHAPRHLDRNIALVGRVIAGIEHLSSLPRGTGPLGFYEAAEERVAIRSIRLGDEVSGLPRYQYLSTESESFARYADARANRRDPFFIVPAGGADICNIPVPVRRVPQ